MSLVSILLIVVAVLTFLTGVLSLIGASKGDRGHIAWFTVSNMGSVIWILSCGGFLGLSSEANDLAVWVVYGIYLGAFLMLAPLVGYSGWKYTSGKIMTVIAILFSVILSVVLLHDPNLLYTDIVLSRAGNEVLLRADSWYYWAYSGLLALIIVAFCGLTYYRAKHARTKRMRRADYVLLGGLSVAGVVSSIFNLLMPIMGEYSMIWVGPLTIGIVMISYFYAILRYRVVSLATGALKAFAYVVTLAAGAMIYMLIFYLIFTALFKIPNPSASILVLNFIMIVIVLLLIPVINEVTSSIKSMIMVGQVDIAYVIKKLNKLASKNVDLRELAGFLADHLHFTYVGFIINGKLYGSKALAVSADELNSIIHMKSTPRGEVWQEPNKTVKKILDDLDLKAVAELHNAKGKTFGQIVVGKPLGKSTFERRDLIQLEMVINLVAAVIDSEKHLRA